MLVVFTVFYWALLAFYKLNRVLLSISRVYWVFIGFYLVFVGVIELY